MPNDQASLALMDEARGLNAGLDISSAIAKAIYKQSPVTVMLEIDDCFQLYRSGTTDTGFLISTFRGPFKPSTIVEHQAVTLTTLGRRATEIRLWQACWASPDQTYHIILDHALSLSGCIFSPAHLTADATQFWLHLLAQARTRDHRVGFFNPMAGARLDGDTEGNRILVFSRVSPIPDPWRMFIARKLGQTPAP